MNISTTGLPLHDSAPGSLGELRPRLRFYSKFVCAAVIFLIFMGALVTSHDAGLSVPDWPTTYGENMFLYSPSKWVGPIFYEHVHRLVASGIGMLTVILTIWICRVEKRRWVKVLSLCSLGAVILQGLLGGLTVLLQLPDAVSVAHGMLAQTFFCMIIVLAYSQSDELRHRLLSREGASDTSLFRFSLLVWGVIYLQLFFGAVMRHSSSGLAVPDFPTMGGQWLPTFSAEMLVYINQLREAINYAPVTMQQVVYHVVHRGGAVLVVAVVAALLIKTLKSAKASPQLRSTARSLAIGVVLQFLLGVLTVLSIRQPYLASIHVMVGALLLGEAVMAALRSYPLRR
ncbi:MAG: COX15/CtaA family protein [Deltaproteobacteria bacterium]|nr:COX15/CtaA family protein [Deltaproteobacteria bacterium]